MPILNLTFDEFTKLYSNTTEFIIPDSFTNSLKSAKLLIESIPKNSKILIFTDSNDLDGMSGGAIQYLSLINLGFEQSNISIYGTNDRSTIPSNINDFDLVITNDVGININFSEYKNNLIVTDHHIINTEFIQNESKNRIFIDLPNICGAYISYLLFIQFDLSEYIKNLIFEYAVLATISDSMPINSFNKINIQKLYSNIKSKHITSKAFYYLIKKFINKFDSSTISFNVIPRLNAPMKLNNSMTNPGEYFDFINSMNMNNWQLIMYYLIGPDDISKYNLYLKINDINEQRKIITTSIYNDITKLLPKTKFNNATEDIQTIKLENITIEYTKYIVEVYAPIQNHISGLIASKMTEYYNVPSIVHSKYTSSIRGENALKFLEIPEIKNNLIAYGGHEEAAGFKVKSDLKLNLKIYKPNDNLKDEKLEKNENLNDKDLKNIIINFDNLTYSEVKYWIFNNMPFQYEPIFIKNITIKNIRIFKELHTQIIDSDGLSYMYFFHPVKNYNIGDNIKITFKIGNTNIINEIINCNNQNINYSNVNFGNINQNINYSNVNFGNINCNNQNINYSNINFGNINYNNQNINHSNQNKTQNINYSNQNINYNNQNINYSNQNKTQNINQNIPLQLPLIDIDYSKIKF